MTIEELVDLEMSEKLYNSQYIKPDLSEDYLSHHGILGQKWNVKHGPPYPLGSKVSTGKRLKSGAAGSIEKKKPKRQTFAEKRKAKKVYKKRVQAAQKARETKARKAEEARAKAAEEERKAKEAQEAQDKAEKDAMEREIWRQDVIKKGDIQSAKEHTDLFSTDEVNQIINKYNADQKLSQLVSDSTPKTPEEKTRLEKMEERVDKIQRFAGTVSKLADSANKVYNAYNTVNDILGSGGKKQEEANKKAEEARKEKEEAWKKNIIMTRDMAGMMANKNRFSSDEINKLLNNVEADEKLAKKLSGGEKEEKPKGNETKKDDAGSGQKTEPSKSIASNNPQPPKQNQSKQSKGEWINDVDEPKTSQRQDITTSRDRQYYQSLSTPVLTLMRANLAEDGYSSQASIVKDILDERRRGGELQYMPVKNSPQQSKKKWGKR